ncbi:hypothetical protein ABZP36_005571 [Zizania latifolia]
MWKEGTLVPQIAPVLIPLWHYCNQDAIAFAIAVLVCKYNSQSQPTLCASARWNMIIIQNPLVYIAVRTLYLVEWLFLSTWSSVVALEMRPFSQRQLVQHLTWLTYTVNESESG